jgi:hypothetical protein
VLDHKLVKKVLFVIQTLTKAVMHIYQFREDDSVMKANRILRSASELSSAEYIADRVKIAYQSLGSDDIPELESLYTEDVHFEDPARALQGLKPLMNHFASLFENLQSCSFKFHQVLINETDIFMSWTMFVAHPKLRNGATIRVEGCSLLRTRHGRIYYHRDYYDLGAMVYEQVPALGLFIKKIRQRLGR